MIVQVMTAVSADKQSGEHIGFALIRFSLSELATFLLDFSHMARSTIGS
jgi:hypothetical protein